MSTSRDGRCGFPSGRNDLRQREVVERPRTGVLHRQLGDEVHALRNTGDVDGSAVRIAVGHGERESVAEGRSSPLRGTARTLAVTYNLRSEVLVSETGMPAADGVGSGMLASGDSPLMAVLRAFAVA